VSAHSQTIRRLRQASGVACVVALIGAASWWFRIGEGLSFDLLSVFTSPTSPTNAIILSMDELSYHDLDQNYGSNWNRSIHADLLRYLKKDGSGPVIFDTFLPDPSAPTNDAEFASAIKEHGRVILAADRSEPAGPGFAGTIVRRPFTDFAEAALGWGVSDATREFDGVVRRHSLDGDLYKSLAAAAFAVLRPEEPDQSASADRWLRYYSGLQRLSYYLATNQAPGFFKDKIVVIGGKPRTQYQAEEADEFRIPYTLLNG
jgi:CHASE2 domain-containing sensor protein